MKNLISIFIMLIAIVGVVNSQSKIKGCEFSKYEVDDMTDQLVIITKRKLLKTNQLSKPSSLFSIVSSIDGRERISFLLYRVFGGVYSIDKGDKIIIKFSDDDKVTIINDSYEIAEKAGSGAASQWYVPYYPIVSEETLEKLKSKQITKIRLYHSDGYSEFKIKKKKKNSVVDQFGCIDLAISSN